MIGCWEEKRTLSRASVFVSAFSYITVENLNPGARILTGFPCEGRRARAKRNARLTRRITRIQKTRGEVRALGTVTVPLPPS